MNKEFTLLNDNTIEVINEEGIETNRGQYENNNIKNILLCENKIEIIETIEEKLEKVNTENKKVIFLANGMLITSAIMVVLFVLGGFVYGAVTHPNDFINFGILRSIECFVGAIIPATIEAIYFGIIKPIFKKRIKKTEKILNKTNTMKKEYEKELSTEKEKVLSNTLEPLVKVSLEEETNIIAKQMSEELIKYHQENIKQRGKVKIRKR